MTIGNPNKPLVIDYIKKYPQYNKAALANLIFLENPGIFNNVDQIRSLIRRYFGAMGRRSRKGLNVPEIPDTGNGTRKQAENVEDGTSEIEFDSPNEIKTLDELIAKCAVDVSIWKIVRYVQNYWGNRHNPNWQVKVWLAKKTEEQLFQDAFIAFLSTYKPCPATIATVNISDKPDACLILNKQDAHLNKHDVHGNNDLEKRFDNVLNKLEIIVQQSILSNNLESITYILGSDEFNSEWTNMTTKGTPQQNVGSYQDSFEVICNHEVKTINMLISNSQKVDIVFVPGNHDEYAGWHIVNWLKTYFRTTDRVSFDISPAYRKYIGYGNTALMFNHGDAIKPVKLAALFPMEFKDNWSAHKYFYIFTGDKHHEVSHDFNGIKFYQLPAFSSAKSLWDEKNGYTCSRAEATGFLIEKTAGMTNILKQYL